MAEEKWLNDFAFTVEEFLSEEECEQFIRISEDIGFDDATVTTELGNTVRTDLRNNQRAMFSDEATAARLWEKAGDFVPREMEGRIALGLNELFRFYRYDVGQRFNWHQDFSFGRDNGEQSLLTMLIYLNDGFSGGETSFEDSYSPDSFDEFQVVPQTGMALFFEHPTHHKGEPVRRGRKYVLRTDVMYSAEE